MNCSCSEEKRREEKRREEKRREEESTTKGLQSALQMIGAQLPAIQDVYITRCHRNTKCIMKDSSHSSRVLFTLLPSGKRLRTICTGTARFTDTFYPCARRVFSTPQSKYHTLTPPPLFTVTVIVFSRHVINRNTYRKITKSIIWHYMWKDSQIITYVYRL